MVLLCFSKVGRAVVLFCLEEEKIRKKNKNNNGEGKSGAEKNRELSKQASDVLKETKWASEESFRALYSLRCRSCPYHFLSNWKDLPICHP